MNSTDDLVVRPATSPAAHEIDADRLVGITDRDGSTVSDTPSPGGLRPPTDSEQDRLYCEIGIRSVPEADVDGTHWSRKPCELFTYSDRHESYLQSRPVGGPYDPTLEYGHPHWREPESDDEAAARTAYLDQQRPATVEVFAERAVRAEAGRGRSRRRPARRLSQRPSTRPRPSTRARGRAPGSGARPARARRCERLHRARRAGSGGGRTRRRRARRRRGPAVTATDDQLCPPEPPPPRGPSRLSRGCAVVRERIGAAVRRGLPRVRRAAGRELHALPALVRERARAVAPDCAPWVRGWLGSSSWGPRAAAVAARLVRVRLYLILAVLGAALVWLALAQTTPSWLVLATAVALEAPLVLATALVLARERYRQTPYARTRERFGAEGWADSWDLHRGPSARAVREVAARQRPSLTSSLPSAPSRDEVGVVPAAVAQLQRARAIDRLPVTECGTWLGRSAVGPWWGTDCYAAHRDVVGLIAPPQTGKTALMIHHVIDHPGAVISTSTKPEIYLYSAALRAAVSGPDEVALFNPDNLGGLGSNLRWCPVRGCADFSFASRRAALLVGEPDTDDDRRWKGWASSVLTALLMVADLDGRSMVDVARWVHNQEEDTPGGVGEALTLMRGRHQHRVPEVVVDSLAQLLAIKAVKTRDSVFFAMRDAVAFMADSEIAWLCTPGRDEPMFDVERFIERRGALYLLGSEDQDNSSAPLLAAFTGYVIAAARRLATMRPSGRLDPPLLGSLDEVALITPIPLPNLVTDAGGRGIHFEWSVQTPSQLRERWGEEGAETILNATNALLVFGGLKATDDLEEASGWCGFRHEFVPDPDGPEGSARAKNERVPVCPADRVRLIPQWHALLIYRTTVATLVRMWPGWERDDVRAAGAPPQLRTRTPEPMAAPRGSHDRTDLAEDAGEPRHELAHPTDAWPSPDGRWRAPLGSTTPPEQRGAA